MRQIKGILVAALTFFASVAIYFVILNFALDKSKPLVEPVKYSSLPMISLCDAISNLELYEEKDIRVRVYLRGKDGYRYWVLDAEKRCDNSEVEVRFYLDEESINKTDEFLKQFTKQYSENFITLVEVEMIGKIRISSLMEHFRQQFFIEAKEIRQISPIKQFTFTEWSRKVN